MSDKGEPDGQMQGDDAVEKVVDAEKGDVEKVISPSSEVEESIFQPSGTTVSNPYKGIPRFGKRKLITIVLALLIVTASAIVAIYFAIEYNKARRRVVRLTTPIREYNVTDPDGGVQKACVEYEDQTDCLTFLSPERRELQTSLMLGNSCIITKGSHFLPTSSPGYTIRTYHHDAGTEFLMNACTGSLTSGGSFDSCAVNGNLLQNTKTASASGLVLAKDINTWKLVRHGVQIHKYFDTQLMSWFDYEVTYMPL
eukprot:scaffold25485_cov127-Cylindrotheca_fusiformis.AAC.1